MHSMSLVVKVQQRTDHSRDVHLPGPPRDFLSVETTHSDYKSFRTNRRQLQILGLSTVFGMNRSDTHGCL